MKFNKGDIIRRTCDGDSVNRVTRGGHYTVISCYNDGVRILDDCGIAGNFDIDNFVLVVKEEIFHNLEVGDRVMWNGKTMHDERRVTFNVAGLDMTKTYTVDAIFPNSVSLQEVKVGDHLFYNTYILECKLKHVQGNDYQVKINY